MKALSKPYVSRLTTAAYNRMEIERDGMLTKDDREWNKCHGPRNYQVVKAILDHVEAFRLERLTILNMSGMNEGKPDPILYDLLSERFDPAKLSWSVLDHPESLTFTDPHIQQWIRERGIVAIPRDHRVKNLPADTPPADVVLCTEIVEHLDYSLTISLLRSCRAALKPGGMLIVTTPNATYLGHRILFALGQWDFLHFNDAPANVEQGLVGHILYYDTKRLSRMLAALDYTDIKASTFNAGHGPGEYRNLATRAAAIALRALSTALPHSGQVLQVLARRRLE